MGAAVDLEYPILHVGLVVGTEIISVVGLMVHIFITTVNVIDWKKAGTMTIHDQVIISIVISKMCLQFIIQINVFWGKSCNVQNFIISFLTDTGYDSTVYSFIWLSTLLSAVYYLKVSNHHNVFLLSLRLHLSKRILHIIFAIFLISFALSLVNNGISYRLFSKNATQHLLPIDIHVDPVGITLLVLFNVTPFLLCFFSSLLLISSLCYHVNQMKCNNGTLTLSLDVYYRTIKYTTVSVINCALYVTIIILIQDYYCLFSIFIFNFILTSLSTSHSIYIVYGTTKLRKWFSRILHHGINCLMRRRESCPSAMVNAVCP